MIFGLVIAYFWTGIQHRRWKDVKFALQGLGFAIETYVCKTDTIPGPTFQGAVTAVLTEFEKERNGKETLNSISPQLLGYLKDNKDPWGRPFIFEQKEDGYLIFIRSTGKNGRDEYGNGDDIQTTVDLRWLKRYKEEEKQKPGKVHVPTSTISLRP
jgi:hypothetical protein